MARASPLLRILADQQATNLDPESWSLLIAEARACGLLSRLAMRLGGDVHTALPDGLSRQIAGAERQAEALRKDVCRELRFIDHAVEQLDTRVIYLKGAAYVAADLPAARGRIFSDIDLLVERRYLPNAESVLMLAGWTAHPQSEYDRRYYREWSHEVPPMTHLQRGTTIDLHHSLIMPTCRIRVDTARMIEESVAIPGTENRFRLKDEDLVLHAASHLLLNSEFDRALRDLWDIDLLIRHFSEVEPNFGDRVMERARSVGLAQIVYRALFLCHRYFGTPLPTCDLLADGFVMWLFAQSTSTRHPDTRPALQTLADEFLRLRELYLRLPSHLLVRHLWHKANTAMNAGETKPA